MGSGLEFMQLGSSTKLQGSVKSCLGILGTGSHANVKKIQHYSLSQENSLKMVVSETGEERKEERKLSRL